MRLAGRQPLEIAPVKGLTDWHDQLSEAYRMRVREERRRYEAERYKPENMFVNKNEQAAHYASLIERISGDKIKIARDYDMLSDWGTYMNNCIASYFNAQCLLGGWYEDGKLIANFELRASLVNRHVNEPVFQPITEMEMAQGYAAVTAPAFTTVVKEVIEVSCTQLLGKHNQPLPTDKRDEIDDLLRMVNVKIPAHRWS